MKTALTLTLKLTLTALALSASSLLLAGDSDRNGFENSRFFAASESSTPRAQLYKKECGSCHMAYQPELLPRRSWDQAMKELDNHFGTDATLAPEDAKEIAAYLGENAADVRGAEKHMARIAASVSPAEPTRISASSYFVREHRKMPERFVTQEAVKSFSNCNACHTKAEAGSYRERDIMIPNYGRWDD